MQETNLFSLKMHFIILSLLLGIYTLTGMDFVTWVWVFCFIAFSPALKMI